MSFARLFNAGKTDEKNGIVALVTVD